MSSRKKVAVAHTSNGEANVGSGQVNMERLKKEVQEQKNQRRRQIAARVESVRRVALGVVVVLLALWLGYYFMYYQPSWGARRKGTARSAKDYKVTTTSGASDGSTVHQAATSPPAGTKETASKQSPGGKKPESKSGKKEAGPGSKTKPKESATGAKTKRKGSSKRPASASNNGDAKNEPQYLNIAELPILRRPVPPSDPDRPFIIDILTGDNLINDGKYNDAVQTFNSILKQFPQSPRASYGKAVALDHLAEQKKKMKLQDTAMDFYYNVAFESSIANDDLKLNALIRLADRAHHREKFSLEIKALIKASGMEPTNSRYATKLGIAYLRAKRTNEAKAQLQEVIEKWPAESMLARANLGYIYYTEGRCEEALPLIMAAVNSNNAGPSGNPKFYTYAGNCLVKLNRSDEAYGVYSKAVKRGLFPSIWQRSLYNEPDLRAQPWWEEDETDSELALEGIRKERDSAKNEVRSLLDPNTGLFKTEGADKMAFSLYQNGKRSKECDKAPVTCALIGGFREASSCLRGRSQFLLLTPSAHIPPHVAPSNTQLRALLPLELFGVLTIRSAKDTRNIEVGEMVILDESFEQELWYHGKDGPALLLAVDFWHPDIPVSNRNSLFPLG